jgi:hypothetical protein
MSNLLLPGVLWVAVLFAWAMLFRHPGWYLRRRPSRDCRAGLHSYLPPEFVLCAYCGSPAPDVVWDDETHSYMDRY